MKEVMKKIMIQAAINAVTCLLLVGAYFGIHYLTKAKDDKRGLKSVVLTLFGPSEQPSIHE